MKITKLETICLSRMHELDRQWRTANMRIWKADGCIVIIHTDAGITGIAEACEYGVPSLMRDVISWLAPTIVGRDPRDPTIIPNTHFKSGTYDCAVAGIDCALWDLRAKIAGKRVCELLDLGGATQDRVRLYASSGVRYDWRHDPRSLIEEALSYVAQGYSAMKFRLGTDWPCDGVTVDRFLGLVRELAQAVDGRMQLMLDGNQRLTPDQALPIARELERLGFTWFEEPLPQTDLAGYVLLNRAVELPISGGEQFTTLEQLKPYFEQRAYDIVQPDVSRCSLTEAVKIARMAEHYGIGVIPHSWHNGLMALQNAHFISALPKPCVLELCMVQGPLQWGILKEQPAIEAGWLTLPDQAGFGAELADNLEARFPYIEGNYFIQVQRNVTTD
jgi:L-alanine-DL-glutamate epimerase-like enolase superfamily enzyme